MADSIIEKIKARIEESARLSAEDGLALFKSANLLGIGALANSVREKINGDRTHYIINRHINFTNVCVNTCAFCAFTAKPGDSHAFEMSLDSIAAEAASAKVEGASEIHIVAGCHPGYSYDYFLEVLRVCRNAYPEVHLQAYTAVEIDHLARISGKRVKAVLEDLVEAGLGSIPGGGAEILVDAVREKICPDKTAPDRWLEIHRTAHKMGLRSNATMLYGTVETYANRIEHMLKLRDLQEETGGFLSFIPLAFHPEHTKLAHLPRLGAVEDLKNLAIGRVMLDNFDHVKAFWIMLGPKLAQVSQSFGVDDIDGTVREEKITHMAGATTPTSLSVPELEHMIREAGRAPVRRDTLYNILN